MVASLSHYYLLIIKCASTIPRPIRRRTLCKPPKPTEVEMFVFVGCDTDTSPGYITVFFVHIITSAVSY